MRKMGLGVVAMILAILLVVVLFTNFDGLPKPLRQSIEGERRELTASQQQFRSASDEIRRAISNDPGLFHSHAMEVLFPERLQKDSSSLDKANAEMASLEKLAKDGKKDQRSDAEQLLNEERSLRTHAIGDALALQKEVRRWVDAKQNLPKYIQQEEQSYEVVKSVDLSALTAEVQKAESDWPAKRYDLESRISALRAIPAQANQVYDSTAALRQQASAKPTDFDYGKLLTAVDTLQADRQTLVSGEDELKALTGQLYTSYDKLLVDLEKRKKDDGEQYEEKLKTVRTTLADSTGKPGNVTSEENWVEVPKNTYESMEDKLGMAIEHKSAGKYDTEADRVPQPAGFAYMAPPSQGRNQYGYWEQQNGTSVWNWLPQYLILSHLLYNNRYEPASYYEYNNYYAYNQRHTTYYGQASPSEPPKYGTFGTSTATRYSDSRYVNSGSYRSSRYASQNGGSLTGTRFGTNGGGSSQPAPRPSYSSPERGGFGSSSGRGFGSPRPSYRAPSGGRRFGRR